MLKKDIMDFTFEYARLSSLVYLLGKTVYTLINDRKYKFIISDIKVSKIDADDYRIYLIGQPVAHAYYSFYHTEIELDLSELGKSIFYNEKALNEYKIGIYKKRQLSLFGDCL